jgi:hypothetical protein
MTMTINNQSVKKTVLNFAIKMARKSQITVVIYGSKTDAGVMNHMVSTQMQWDNCSNKNELVFVTKIDKEGNFID